MKLIRAIVLGAIVVLSLLGGTTVANATPGAGSDAGFADNDGWAQTDPGDPGFPPDQ